ncbi:hypothetical protein NPIL_344971 [Nephila pilipes]|uniref:Uncharacterized protein n=1 Tax=Nephila pilipes TaxID=299642 RepID=A0A8X6TNF4_NEPPI|nr:hypothetical protein NPIL_344971 [Nephila pilipes]
MSLISLLDLNTLLIPFSQLCHLIAVLFGKSWESAPIPFNMSLDDIWRNPCDIVHYLRLKILYIAYVHTFSRQILLVSNRSRNIGCGMFFSLHVCFTSPTKPFFNHPCSFLHQQSGNSDSSSPNYNRQLFLKLH